MDVRSLDRRAVEATVAIVEGIEPEHLELPTPCSEWTLRELLQRAVSENRGFAAASLVAHPERSVWVNGVLGLDPVGAYRAAADLVIAAFSAVDVLERTMEIREFGVFPAPAAMRMHLIDNVVHGWDLARALGLDYEPDSELVEASLAIAERLPTDRPPGSAFKPVVELSADSSALHRTLALAGRSPDWHP